MRLKSEPVDRAELPDDAPAIRRILCFERPAPDGRAGASIAARREVGALDDLRGTGLAPMVPGRVRRDELLAMFSAEGHLLTTA
jgi:hypothetical protein